MGDGDGPYKASDADLLGEYKAPAGVGALASDNTLANALHITEPEWHALASIDLPGEISKDGHVQLLVTIRAIT